jgi:3-deoxy-D-manno-octulosonic-acid transferase
MKLKLYKYMALILHPFLVLYLFYRLYKGKEDPNRIGERLGKIKIERPKNKIIWLHAASVGEVLSVIPLLKMIEEHYLQYRILLTTGTVSSSKIIVGKVSEQIIHQFVPIDSPAAVKRFLEFWKPEIALWVESEFWPNLLQEAAKNMPIICVNGRISDYSYNKWSRYSDSINQLMKCFSLVLAQSRQDAERFIKLGAGNVYMAGNIKYSIPDWSVDENKLAKLKDETSNRLIFMAASTHSDEEAQIAYVHSKLKEKYSDILTIISPRHINRKKDIVESIKAINNKLNISIRSLDQEITKDTDIYIADTMGEYGILYRLTTAVFIGGSLVPHGGQNLLEPARLGNLIILGPYMHNFREITEDFLAAKAAVQVNNKEDLYDKLSILLDNKKEIENYTKNAKQLVSKSNNNINIVFEKIDSFLSLI